MGMYCKARLCILSRVFQSSSSSTLVPLIDLINHSHDPGCQWFWSVEKNAMVITATREHKAGEELLDSYGSRSNVLYYRTYGFTQAPWDEPLWNYVLRAERARNIFDAFLPVKDVHDCILLESQSVDATLSKALAAVAEHGQSPSDFLT